MPKILLILDHTSLISPVPTIEEQTHTIEIDPEWKKDNKAIKMLRVMYNLLPDCENGAKSVFDSWQKLAKNDKEIDSLIESLETGPIERKSARSDLKYLSSFTPPYRVSSAKTLIENVEKAKNYFAGVFI